MAESSAWEVVQEEFACEHKQTEIRRMICSNGKVQYARQCLRCGHNCGFVKRETIGIRFMTMVNFDEGLRDDWGHQRTERLQQIRDQASQQWWSEYDAYLSSPQWRAKREAVLKRDNWMCKGCGVKRANQVHHLTYERRGREMLFDLVAICEVCHEAIHAKEE